eukprot:CAMPEP_0118705436 /NCGR_PEP_ID=MMETSP0800-20121206/19865_1 /TAXON_ID=210618 ORGANISM="Striatella unipunctata, Strain CCMP2910" /NCGR_SAMPLE_ID=MMETSP0800 /ASSEMBLY_ACC=CAM_ASM_000638 /LENGTH=96 /DNA_ID=CAMNT_0006607587 /DNA_START=59 /DNA_END=352 /DNA_ORIENTATION=+
MDVNHPIHGVCQGNGAGPAIWTVISTTLLNMLREANFGLQIHCSLDQKPIHIVSFGYVDDFDLIQSGQNATEAVSKLQQAIQLWERACLLPGPTGY